MTFCQLWLSFSRRNFDRLFQNSFRLSNSLFQQLGKNSPGQLGSSNCTGMQDPFYLTCSFVATRSNYDYLKTPLQATHTVNAIQRPIAKKTIEEVQQVEDHFTSTLFLVDKDKSKEDFRPIIILKFLNKWVGWPFRLESIPVIHSFIKGCTLGSSPPKQEVLVFVECSYRSEFLRQQERGEKIFLKMQDYHPSGRYDSCKSSWTGGLKSRLQIDKWGSLEIYNSIACEEFSTWSATEKVFYLPALLQDIYC